MKKRQFLNIFLLIIIYHVSSCEGVKLDKKRVNLTNIDGYGEIIYTGENKLDTVLNAQCANFYQREFNDTLFQLAGGSDALIISTLFEIPLRRIKSTYEEGEFFNLKIKYPTGNSKKEIRSEILNFLALKVDSANIVEKGIKIFNCPTGQKAIPNESKVLKGVGDNLTIVNCPFDEFVSFLAQISAVEIDNNHNCNELVSINTIWPDNLEELQFVFSELGIETKAMDLNCNFITLSKTE
ncbi:hypothetical protein [Crocinitomix catalasitica]|uniref:hypothetical protein n=1 Tax=Crocinitomix catalasitica TaxID=184607 RepID=UPI000486D6A8|nr:hypothetical protein [Crocinitomix catalasitica]